MHQYRQRLIYVLFACSALTHGQNGPLIAGGGYLNPDVFRVAPGQVITVFVHNVKTLLPQSGGDWNLRGVRAASLPLPTSLAGFSARIQRAVATYDVPIISVLQVPICSNEDTVGPMSRPPETPECWMTALTLQIPFEVVPPPPYVPKPIVPRLIVREGQNDSTSIVLYPFTDNIHIVTLCDATAGFNAMQGGGVPCFPQVTHADGYGVDSANPARPGEIVVVYAFGLGLTNPTPETGAATPSPAPTVPNRLHVQFDFRPGAGPSQPNAQDASVSPILFAGLTPTMVGLYQLNIKLPDHFPPVASCLTIDAAGTASVNSNLTISISGLASFDGAGICVDTGQ